MMKALRIIIAILVFTTLSSCGVDQPSTAAPAFYHWKTHFRPSTDSEQLRQRINSDRLYVKFFDVDWDYKSKAPIPLAEVIWQSEPTAQTEIVPTVFITNRVLIPVFFG